LKTLSYLSHCRIHSNASFSVVLLQQFHCYAIWLLRYYGNATNSLLHNRNYYVTMEMQYTHCYTTGTITLLWKRHQRLDMSQYVQSTRRCTNFFITNIQRKHVRYVSNCEINLKEGLKLYSHTFTDKCFSNVVLFSRLICWLVGCFLCSFCGSLSGRIWQSRVTADAQHKHLHVYEYWKL
jgi:hypothetical protein